MNDTIMGISLGLASGIIAGVLLGNRITASNTQKWRKRMESKQIDTDIRLDLLEYNHLHEDGFLRMFVEEAADNA